MKKNWLVSLALVLSLFIFWTEPTQAQGFSLGLKLPIELQTLSLHGLYNNLEITGAYTFAELVQIESSLLIPIEPLFVSANAKFFLLSLGPEICYTPLCDATQERRINAYVGAGFAFISVASEALWGFQGFAGLDWALKDIPIAFSLELGFRAFTIFLGSYSGLFVNIGTRVNF